MAVKSRDMYFAIYQSIARGLCCANAMKDSPCESSMATGLHEQTEAPDLPHH
jgi:hypothetical protein